MTRLGAIGKPQRQLQSAVTVAVPDNGDEDFVCEQHFALIESINTSGNQRDHCIVEEDGWYTVRVSGMEKLRTDDRCLACRYLASKLGRTIAACAAES